MIERWATKNEFGTYEVYSEKISEIIDRYDLSTEERFIRVRIEEVKQ